MNGMPLLSLPMNPQSLEQANSLLAACAGSTATGAMLTRPLSDVGREVGLPSPLALARAVRALVSRGRLAAEDGGYRLVDVRPIEPGEKVSAGARTGRRTRRRAGRAGAGAGDGVPTYNDLGRAVVERLVELARETAALSELTDLRRELREERSARVRAEERANELHQKARDYETKLEMAEENLRRVMGVVRQKSAAAKPSDPEAQALLAILRANGPGEGQEGEDSERPSSS